MFAALILSLTVFQVPAGSKVAAPEPRYEVYWLSKQGGNSEYRVLLVTRVPLEQLAKQVVPLQPKGAPPLPIFEYAALTIQTYQKDSVWNTDRQPLKAVTRFADPNEKDQTVQVNGVPYRYEKGTLAEAVRLLNAPQGKIPIHRVHAPLAGMEQTARALKLLLQEQLTKDGAKDNGGVPAPRAGGQ